MTLVPLVGQLVACSRRDTVLTVQVHLLLVLILVCLRPSLLSGDVGSHSPIGHDFVPSVPSLLRPRLPLPRFQLLSLSSLSQLLLLGLSRLLPRLGLSP